MVKVRMILADMEKLLMNMRVERDAAVLDKNKRYLGVAVTLVEQAFAFLFTFVHEEE